jgi:hypothetical protein
MAINEPLDHKQVRVAALLVILGLLVEGWSLVWNHPLAPDLFFYVGLPLLAGGILVFIYSFAKHFLRRWFVRRET